MADQKLIYSALPALTTVLSDDGTAPTLKGLSSSAKVLSNSIDNTSGNPWGSFKLTVKGSSTFAANGYIALYILPANDGTNFDTGDASNDPSEDKIATTFSLKAVSSQMQITRDNVTLPPCKFKVLVVNSSGVALSSSNGDCKLEFASYTQVQTDA